MLIELCGTRQSEQLPSLEVLQQWWGPQKMKWRVEFVEDSPGWQFQKIEAL